MKKNEINPAILDMLTQEDVTAWLTAQLNDLTEKGIAISTLEMSVSVTGDEITTSWYCFNGNKACGGNTLNHALGRLANRMRNQRNRNRITPIKI